MIYVVFIGFLFYSLFFGFKKGYYMNRFTIGALLLSLTLLFSACSPAPVTPVPPQPSVISVQLFEVVGDDRFAIDEDEYLSVIDGGFINLAAEVLTENGGETPPVNFDRVFWTSNNTSVALVQERTGFVTTLTDGTATVTATSYFNQNISASVTVVVQPRQPDPEPEPEPEPQVTDLYITRNGERLVPGQEVTVLFPGENSATLGYVIRAVNGANPAVEWESADASVATVRNGIITPRRIGSTVVTVTSVYDDTFSVSVPVVVLAPVTGVTILPAQADIYVDERIFLSATVTVARPDVNTGLIWTSSNTDVLTVIRTVSGVEVVPRSEGVASVRAQSAVDRSVFDEIQIRVRELDGVLHFITIDSIAFEPGTSSVEVLAGRSIALRALFDYTGRINDTVQWTLSDTTFARLSPAVTEGSSEYTYVAVRDNCPDDTEIQVVAESRFDPTVSATLTIVCSNP